MQSASTQVPKTLPLSLKYDSLCTHSTFLQDTAARADGARRLSGLQQTPVRREINWVRGFPRSIWYIVRADCVPTSELPRRPLPEQWLTRRAARRGNSAGSGTRAETREGEYLSFFPRYYCHTCAWLTFMRLGVYVFERPVCASPPRLLVVRITLDPMKMRCTKKSIVWNEVWKHRVLFFACSW